MVCREPEACVSPHPLIHVYRYLVLWVSAFVYHSTNPHPGRMDIAPEQHASEVSQAQKDLGSCPRAHQNSVPPGEDLIESHVQAYYHGCAIPEKEG